MKRMRLAFIFIVLAACLYCSEAKDIYIGVGINTTTYAPITEAYGVTSYIPGDHFIDYVIPFIGLPVNLNINIMPLFFLACEIEPAFCLMGLDYVHLPVRAYFTFGWLNAFTIAASLGLFQELLFLESGFHYAAQMEIGLRVNLFCFYGQLLYIKEIPFDARNQYFFSGVSMILMGVAWYF